MVQQGGLGRGLASLIPQKNLKQKENEEIRKTDEDQSYLSSAKKENNLEFNLQKQSITKREFSSQKVAQNKKKKEASAKKVGQENANSKKLVFREGVEIVSVDKIVPNPHQPRTRFNESKLAELADSINEHGIIQPLLVTDSGEGTYELIAGERRLEASKIAGLETIPVIVKDANDKKKAEWALVENIQRHDLNPMEESRAYKRMQDKFSMTQEEIAVRVGKNRSTIANSLRLLNLPIEIQRALMDEKISEGHAKTILGISNPEKQRALFELILKESLNVRQTEGKVRDALGGGVRKRIKSFDPDIHAKQEKISQALGTKVEIKKGSRGGKIIIDFYSEEEFNALLTNLIPEDD